MQIDFTFINKTPIFVSPNDHPDWSRVLGATYDPVKRVWLFPAFPPFRDNVLRDINCVYPEAEFSETAIEWYAQHAQNYKEVQSFTLPCKNYEHQNQGLSKVLYNYRGALEWGMGTGKTKVILDAVNILRGKTLVLCPLVAADNWKAEADKFIGDSLSVVVIQGSRTRKIDCLKEALRTDLIVVPYDTARLYGVPTFHAETVELFEKAQRAPTVALKRNITSLNDKIIQARLAKEWLQGRSVRDIRKEVFNLLPQLGPQWLTDIPYTIIVADESHRLRNIKSNRTKVSLQLASHASRRYLLSGTINLGDPRHLYPQLRFLAHYLMPYTWTEFCSKHVKVSPWNRHVVTGFTNLHVLNTKLASVSHTKTLEECTDMPERITQDIPFDLATKQVDAYNQIILDNTVTRTDDSTYTIPNGGVRLSKLLQICSGFMYVPEDTDICDTCINLQVCVEECIQPGSTRCIQDVEIPRQIIRYENPKLDALKDKLEDIWATPHPKCIVWATFREELNDIEDFLQSKKIKYIRVDGSNSSHIQKFNQEFQTDPDCLVWLGQIATGISITLTAAAYMIYYSRDWSLDNWLQSQDRNYRIGQTKRTVVYRLCAKNSVELAQLAALDARMDVKELLSKRIDCVTCHRYDTCFKHNIEPWTDLCIVPRNKKRYVTEVCQILPEIS